MRHIDFECDDGHGIKVDLPDEVFINGPLILPCPTCGRKYTVDSEGHHKRFKRRIIQFPALHY